jgi:inosine-uridine nucleoside N-ribohydrolase
MIDPTIFNFKKGPVRVVTEGIAIGQIIMPNLEFQIQIDPLTWKGKPLVSAAFEVNAERFLKQYEVTMLGIQQ